MPRGNVVLFDLDDRLLDYSGDAARCWSEACATVAAPAGVDADALRAAIRDVGTLFWSDPERHRLERTDMMGAWRKIVEGALDRCGGLRDGPAARGAADLAGRPRATGSPLPAAPPPPERLRAPGIRPRPLTYRGC